MVCRQGTEDVHRVFEFVMAIPKPPSPYAHAVPRAERFQQRLSRLARAPAEPAPDRRYVAQRERIRGIHAASDVRINGALRIRAELRGASPCPPTRSCRSSSFRQGSYLLGLVAYVRRRRATPAPIARIAAPTKERLVGSGIWLPPTSLMITYVTCPAAPATKPG